MTSAVAPVARDSFHSVGGTTVTLGLGRVTDRPVARDGELLVARSCGSAWLSTTE
jgi:hypothetical protein